MQSQWIRFKDSLAQKMGGFQKFFAGSVSGVPRDLHAWQDLNQTNHLSVGTTTQLGVITSGSVNVITPQTTTTDFTANGNFSFTSGSASVGITDSNISNVTVLDSVYFNTPIYGGGIVLSGIYSIATITGTHSYTITAAAKATSTTTTCSPPKFTTSSGSATVSVEIDAHGLVAGNTVVFPIATTGNGVTISGSYVVATVTDANDFTIAASTQATGSSTFTMNSGNAEIVYYINLGPPAAGVGYGTGLYGAGGYGTGNVPASQTGTPITATDWTQDNWGQILLACPSGGGIYQFDPTGGFNNAGLVPNAPIFNGGIFVSMAQQIAVAWGSTVQLSIGLARDPLLVKWSTSGDYTVWIPLTTNQAGSFRIPIGSKVMGGMAVSNQNLIWTDIDLWAMSYQGLPYVFGFNKIGAGAGAISSHSMQQLRGNVYWMGSSNFYAYSSSGVMVIPCPVWDFVFQNLNTAFTQNVRAMPNTPFNEIGWLFPSSASASGECDSYVKMNITEPNAPWDYGSLSRSAWIDLTVLGNPIAAASNGIIYQHETTNDADGSPISWSWTTGYFEIADGEDFVFVDQVIPDFKYGTYGGSQGANIQLSFNVTNFPGDTPTTYGPYNFTNTTEYISPGFRGRQMQIVATGSDLGSFNRLGRIRYRWAPDGRA